VKEKKDVGKKGATLFSVASMHYFVTNQYFITL